MRSFSSVLREYTNWLTSFRLVNLVLPYHLYILFGGVGFMLVYDILATQAHKYYTLLHTIGHYAFFAGIFLTLAAPNKKYFPYALWAYVFYVLFPFKSFSLYQVIESVIYVALGYWFFKFEAQEALQSGSSSSSSYNA